MGIVTMRTWVAFAVLAALLLAATMAWHLPMMLWDHIDLVPMYDELYASRYVRKDYEKRVQEVVSLMRQRYGAKDRRAKLAKNPLESAGQEDLL